MFLKVTTSGYKGGQQRTGGHFMAVFHDDDSYADPRPGREGQFLYRLWAVTRLVRLEQLGHWMTGHMNLLGHHFCLSGGMGSDGLPMSFRALRKPDPAVNEWKHYDVPAADIAELKERFLTPIPEDLCTVYWSSDGHNEVGFPASAQLRKWGLENLTTRAKPKKKAPREKSELARPV